MKVEPESVPTSGVCQVRFGRLRLLGWRDDFLAQHVSGWQAADWQQEAGGAAVPALPAIYKLLAAGCDREPGVRDNSRRWGYGSHKLNFDGHLAREYRLLLWPC